MNKMKSMYITHAVIGNKTPTVCRLANGKETVGEPRLPHDTMGCGNCYCYFTRLDGHFDPRAINSLGTVTLKILSSSIESETKKG
jgi:hypothetical protein